MQIVGTNSFQEVLEAVLFGGWSIPPTAHVLALLWEPNWGEHDVHFICGVDIVRIGTNIERCVSLVFLFWGEVGNFCSSQVVPRERARSPKSESRHEKFLGTAGRALRA